jgi:hypothetical protein
MLEPERRPEPIPRASEEELSGLEERIADEEQRLPTLDPAACVDRCRSVDAICDASARICEIASELGSGDVAARCERASRSCDAARGGTDPSCPCAATPAIGAVSAAVPARL